MTQKVNVNDIELVPASEVAKAVGLSADYVSRLARENKIFASQIKRQWYVDPASVRQFIESAKIEKEARRRQLREERRHEQVRKHTKQLEAVRAERVTDRRVRHVAVASATTVLVGFLCLGTLGWGVGSTVLTHWSGASPESSDRPRPAGDTHIGATTHNLAAVPGASSVREPADVTTDPEGPASFWAVVPGESARPTSTDTYLAARFSDPVVVSRVNEATVVSPVFTGTSAVQYRVLDAEIVESVWQRMMNSTTTRGYE